MCVSVTSPFIGAFALLKSIIMFLLRFGERKRKILLFGETETISVPDNMDAYRTFILRHS